MKKITIISILVLLASWWVVGQANSKFTVDGCNYDEVCEEWCEDPGSPEIPDNECAYDEECKEWCDDDDCVDGECDDDDCVDGECDDDDCVDGECDDDDCVDGECDDGGDPDPEGELCIPMDNIMFDLDIGGFLKFIGYIDIDLN